MPNKRSTSSSKDAAEAAATSTPKATTTVTTTTTTTTQDHDALPPPRKSASTSAATPVTPPDGGWGWMIVLSSFMISVFVDGICFSVGIFFDPFKEYFGSTSAQTAWVGSVLNGTYLIVGPLVSALVNRYGCRKMAMVGSVVATVSFFLSTFSNNISVLIVTYGFMGGFGYGLVYLPAMVMVGYYFEKRRALATGIACCGSGIGAFVFAPLAYYLLEIYSWKGALWILSGIVLNGLVFSVFYRPLEHEKHSPKDNIENGKDSTDQSKALLQNENDGKMDAEYCSIDDDYSSSKTKDPKPFLRGDADHDEVIKLLKTQTGDIFPTEIHIEVVPHGDGKTGTLESEMDRDEEKKNETLIFDRNAVKLRESLKKEGKGERPLSEIVQFTTPHHLAEEPCSTKPYVSNLHLKEKANPLARLAYSHDAIGMHSVKKRHPHGTHHPHHHHHNHMEAENPLQRKDIFYSGSLRHIPEYQSSENMADYRRKVMTVDEVEVMEDEESGEEGEGEQGSVGKKKKRGFWRRMVRDPLLQVFDVSLLRSPTFVIYGISCSLCMLGFFVPFIYLPTLCTDLGMGSDKSAFLISIIGIANTVGRVIVGLVSDQPWADCLLINNVALIVGGAATCCVPLLNIYPLFAVYTLVFGSSIAIFVSLRSIIMVELMGLQKLTNAFGLVIMFQGISTYIGAPIAGMLYDATGDYNVSFYIAGIVLALSGIICLPLRRIAKWETAREQRNSLQPPQVIELQD